MIENSLIETIFNIKKNKTKEEQIKPSKMAKVEITGLAIISKVVVENMHSILVEDDEDKGNKKLIQSLIFKEVENRNDKRKEKIKKDKKDNSYFSLKIRPQMMARRIVLQAYYIATSNLLGTGKNEKKTVNKNKDIIF